jgi:hypothetical protein
MAYYTAMITKWGTLSGTTASKLTQINAATATGAAIPAIFSPSTILNACVAADIASLTTAQISLLTLLLAGASVDASQSTTVRAGIQAIFAGKTTTLSQLGALVAPYDSPTVPWWQANGYPRAFDMGDVTAAGLS